MSVLMEISCEGFKSAYHTSIAEELMPVLHTFVSSQLCPQIPEVIEVVRGSLVPQYPEEKNCGPKSVIRDVYRLEISFHGAEAELGDFKRDIRISIATGEVIPNEVDSR